MDDDRHLLRQFTQHNSQEAFAALTTRYLRLVYSTCRRELDDSDLAEDVTQAVFLILARKAPSLRREVVLSGWLFQTARFAARNARTSEQRRKAHEQKAADSLREQQMETEDAAWNDIEPLLNQSLATLRDAERECVLLRFFQGMSFAEAGTALGVSEEAARKRVTRALEKMRQVFIKNGVIVPSAALAVLLTAHAAKAAPAACQESVAHLTASALIGSRVYPLSEGILKAMKIAQIKTVVGLTATVAVIIGFSTYAVGRPVTLPRTSVLQVAPLNAGPKAGHVLHPVHGKTALTAAQIAERCKNAYAALTTYQGATSVVSRSVIASDPQAQTYHTSAAIQFVKPGKIRAVGTDMSGENFAYISDGLQAEETNGTLHSNWRKDASSEMAIASVTGIAQSAATTIPALLLGTSWGTPVPLKSSGNSLNPEVREDTVDGRLCYLLTGHGVGTTSVWVDEKTYLLHRLVQETDTAARTIPVGGKPFAMPAIKMHTEEQFTNERLKEPIPDSTFALPPVQ